MPLELVVRDRDVSAVKAGGLTQDDAVKKCAQVVRAGGVAVFPTDTVYGIGLLVSAHPMGADELFRIKRRPQEKKIPLLIPSVEALFEYGENVDGRTEALARQFWPGGLTLVVRASKKVPPAYRNLDGTVALRVPGRSFALALLENLGEAMAVTSANTSGLPAPIDDINIEEAIMGQVGAVVRAGKTDRGESSTIVDCTKAEITVLRAGAIAQTAIQTVWRKS
jgi:tRNA threonylcarbamoyl adenosine modification protein (Sua5/YciO/YrdC/YwlC family)